MTRSELLRQTEEVNYQQQVETDEQGAVILGSGIDFGSTGEWTSGTGNSTAGGPGHLPLKFSKRCIRSIIPNNHYISVNPCHRLSLRRKPSAQVGCCRFRTRPASPTSKGIARRTLFRRMSKLSMQGPPRLQRLWVGWKSFQKPSAQTTQQSCLEMLDNFVRVRLMFITTIMPSDSLNWLAWVNRLYSPQAVDRLCLGLTLVLFSRNNVNDLICPDLDNPNPTNPPHTKT